MQKGSIAIIATASAAFVLGGCAVATPITTPSGQPGYSINCSVNNDIGQCYRKAGELCGQNGYRVINEHNHGQTFWSGANQTLVIQCKTPTSSYVEKPHGK